VNKRLVASSNRTVIRSRLPVSIRSRRKQRPSSPRMCSLPPAHDSSTFPARRRSLPSQGACELFAGLPNEFGLPPTRAATSASPKTMIDAPATDVSRRGDLLARVRSLLAFQFGLQTTAPHSGRTRDKRIWWCATRASCRMLNSRACATKNALCTVAHTQAPMSAGAQTRCALAIRLSTSTLGIACLMARSRKANRSWLGYQRYKPLGRSSR